MRRHLRIVGILALSLFAPVPTEAHSVSTFYPERWTSDTQWWNMTPSVNAAAAFRGRIRDGVAQWNAQAANFDFVEGNQVADYPAHVCPATAGKNGVHEGPIDGAGSTLGRTYTCIVGTSIHSTQILFDEAENWFTSDTGNPLITQIDLESVATHEWGHATGFSGHFSSSESFCQPAASNYETMCSSYNSVQPKAARTLATHDKHTFTAAYPAPPMQVRWNLNTGFDGTAETIFGFGKPGDRFFVGDWNNDGIETPGVRRGNVFYLNNGFDPFAETVYAFGVSGDVPVVGDWNGNGVDTPGIVRGNEWFLDDGFNNGVDYQFLWGSVPAGDVWLGGDWGGGLLNQPDGKDNPGIFRPGSGPGTSTWHLNYGFDSTTELSFFYGSTGDKPLIGDWNDDGRDTPGVVRGNLWYLNNGYDPNVDMTVFGFGTANDIPVAGDWNGDGKTTPGVVQIL